MKDGGKNCPKCGSYLPNGKDRHGNNYRLCKKGLLGRRDSVANYCIYATALLTERRMEHE